MKWPWNRGKAKHSEVVDTLDRHERELKDMSRRVRLLEKEYGIISRHPLKEVNGV